jgi:hypothetical protein
MSIQRILMQLLIVVIALFATGCASSPIAFTPQKRYIAERSAVTPIGAQVSDAALRVTLQSVIVPEGPGSWIHNADWDEYVVTLENRSTQTVRVVQASLIDPRGVYTSPERSMEALKAKSDLLRTEYESFGIAYTKHVGNQAAVIGAMAGPGLLATGGLGATALAAAPIAAVAAPAYVYWVYHSRKTDTEKTGAEFGRRIVPDPLMLAPGANLSGSLYFPTVPSPRALVVLYQLGGTERTLTLSLEEVLQGLHEELSGSGS